MLNGFRSRDPLTFLSKKSASRICGMHNNLYKKRPTNHIFPRLGGSQQGAESTQPRQREDKTKESKANGLLLRSLQKFKASIRILPPDNVRKG